METGIIGELNADGTVKTESELCAVTGRPVLGEHHFMQRIRGTNYFYRVLSDFEHMLTPEKRAEIESQYQSKASPKVSKAEKSEA